jgi:hypothetical protein
MAPLTLWKTGCGSGLPRLSIAVDVLFAVEPQAAVAASRPGGKMGVLLDAVSRPEGATLEELTAAVDWLPHTTRAAITRLRHRGHDVRLASMGSRKAYHLVPSD